MSLRILNQTQGEIKDLLKKEIEMSFRFLTAGESHGKGLVGILEGVPSGLEISIEYLHTHLARRKMGFGRGARQKVETDEVRNHLRHSAWQNPRQSHLPVDVEQGTGAPGKTS